MTVAFTRRMGAMLRTAGASLASTGAVLPHPSRLGASASLGGPLVHPNMPSSLAAPVPVRAHGQMC